MDATSHVTGPTQHFRLDYREVAVIVFGDEKDDTPVDLESETFGDASVAKTPIMKLHFI